MKTRAILFGAVVTLVFLSLVVAAVAFGQSQSAQAPGAAPAVTRPQSDFETSCQQLFRIRRSRDQAVTNLNNYCPPADDYERKLCLVKVDSMVKLLEEMENPIPTRDALGNRVHDGLITQARTFLSTNTQFTTPNLSTILSKAPQKLKTAVDEDIIKMRNNGCNRRGSNGDGSFPEPKHPVDLDLDSH